MDLSLFRAIDLTLVITIGLKVLQLEVLDSFVIKKIKHVGGLFSIAKLN